MVYYSFARIVRPKRKLPAALDSAGGFLSVGFGARRQMRMYAQIFSNARKKFEKSPAVRENRDSKSAGRDLMFF